ncbi:Stereocilin [Trichoplax sp. H2]|nr:Stereocilin [Trichoplax sp. H2]|eukprot:RDD45284.1 Stereocilin [Trichoplax sp. H2]
MIKIAFLLIFRYLIFSAARDKNFTLPNLPSDLNGFNWNDLSSDLFGNRNLTNNQAILASYKRLLAYLQKLPADIKRKLQNSTFIKNITTQELDKIPPELFNVIPAKVIRELNEVQLRFIIYKMLNSQSRTLVRVLASLNTSTFEFAIRELNNHSKRLTREQATAVIDAMKRRYGNDVAKWTLAQVNMINGMLFGFSPRDIKRFTTDIFNKTLAHYNYLINRFSENQRRAILLSLQRVWGKLSTWTAIQIRRLRRLFILLRAHDIKKLQASALAAAIQNIADNQWDRHRAHAVLHVLYRAWGPIRQWTKQQLRSIKNLRTFLPAESMVFLSADTFLGSIKEFGESTLPNGQRIAIVKRLRKNWGQVKTWTADQLKNASHLLEAFGRKELDQLNGTQLANALSTIKNIRLDRAKARLLVKKIIAAKRSEWGAIKTWSKDQIKMLGNLIRGLKGEELQQLNGTAILGGLSQLKLAAWSRVQRKRILKKLSLSNIRANIRNLGNLVRAIRMKDLNNITYDDLTVADLDDDSIRLPFTRAQAMQLFRKAVIKKLGAVGNAQQDNYNFATIRKIGNLALGMTRQELRNLSLDGCIEVVNELKNTDGWSTGQAKEIFMKYKSCLGITSTRNFSQINDIDIAAIGQFISQISHEELGNISKEYCVDAVRALGKVGKFRGMAHGPIRKLLLAALVCKNKVNGATLEDDDIEDLGSLVCGMEAQEVNTISKTAFSNALYKICHLPCMRSKIRKAIANAARLKLYNVDNDDAIAKFTSTDLRNLGPCLKGFLASQLRKLNGSQIVGAIDSIGNQSFTADQAREIVALYKQSLNNAATSSRRRRATSAITASEVNSMNHLSNGLSVADINNMTAEDFQNSIDTLGVSQLSHNQILALVNKAKQIWGDPSTFQPNQFLSLGIINTGFMVSDIAKFNLTSLDAVTPLGQYANYSAAQVQSISCIYSHIHSC